ncbi:MAG: glycosyltransferase family 2 protein [bacterium]|nr:glycosyltransferase family 2 protein [bacterium]
MKKLVSVILTVYNEEKLLAESLNSLIAQTYRPLEIIVVDDGSSDSSRSIAQEFNVKVVAQKHLGLGMSRNRGANEANGEIVVFCDADLLYDTDYLSNLVKPILENMAVGTFHKDEMVKNDQNYWSRCWQINDHLPYDRKIRKDIGDESTYFRAIKRKVFLGVGGFDDTGYLDDRTLYQKLGEKSLGVSEAVCWHYNPESFWEVLEEAKWHGRSLARENTIQAILQYCLLNTIRRIILDTRYSKKYLYFFFKFVYDLGINLGILDYLLRGRLSK